MKPVALPIRPISAWQALREIRRDREQTDQVFKFVDALSGDGAIHRTMTRFRTDPEGKRVLATRPSLLDALNDRDRLAACPPESLGRAYYQFVHSENLTADSLVTASTGTKLATATDPDQHFIGARTREAHDLWHVVTGYGRESIGELLILIFSYAQLRHRGVGVLCLIGAWLTHKGIRGSGIRLFPMMREAYARGTACRWLPPVPWEEWLDKPLADIRKDLGTTPPQQYERQRAAIATLADLQTEQRGTHP